jgi:hypothetical protein
MEPLAVTLRCEDNIEDRKAGIDLTLEGATIILERHLQTTCTTLSYLDRGYNNRTYIAGGSDGREYVIRVSRRGHWTKSKTEGEVAGILYLALKCPEVPVPKILGFCSNSELSGIGEEYILMEKVPGKPLDEIWPSLSFEDKSRLTSQLCLIFVKLKSLTFNKLGSFTLVPRISDTHGIGVDLSHFVIEDIEVGPLLEFSVGPFQEYLPYFREVCEREIMELEKCEFMKPQLRNLDRIRVGSN